MKLAAEFVKCPARLLLDWVSFSVPFVQVFGKTMENVRKRVDVKLLRSDDARRRRFSSMLPNRPLPDKKYSIRSLSAFKITRRRSC